MQNSESSYYYSHYWVLPARPVYFLSALFGPGIARTTTATAPAAERCIAASEATQALMLLYVAVTGALLVVGGQAQCVLKSGKIP